MTVKETSGNTTEECSLTIASTVTITGTNTTTAGKINTGVYVFYYDGSAEGEDVTKGILTVTGNVNIPSLGVGAGAMATLSSGTYGRVSGSETAGDLLAEGYAFQKTDNNAFVEYDTDIRLFSGTPLVDVKVVECKTHSIDTTIGTCKWCGTQFAVMRTIERKSGGNTTTTTEYFATLSEAVKSITNNDEWYNVTITLLDDVTEKDGGTNKKITIDKNIYLTLDLGGHTLTADIKLDMGTDSTYLHMSSNGILAGKLQVVGGSVALSGGTFHEINVGHGKTVGGLLKDGYGYQYSGGENDGTWLEGDALNGTSLTNISVKPLPIKSLSVTLSTEIITYGSTATLTAAAKNNEDQDISTGVSYQWYIKQGESGTGTAITDATGKTYTTPDSLDIGTYTFCCEATMDGYTVKSSEVTITVNKATLMPDSSSGEGGSTSTATYTAPTAKALTYSSNPQMLVTPGTITPADTGCTVYYRVDDGEWTTDVTKVTGINAGRYIVYWYITGNDNYNGVASATAPKSLTVTIAQKTIGSGDITVTGEVYTGEAISPKITVKDGTVTLKAGTDYTVSGDTERTEAGTYALTITGKGNYAGTPTANWTITRKTLTLPTNTYIVYAKTDVAPTADLAQIAKALGMPDDDGALEFYGSDEQSISALPAANESTTLTLSVRSKNHQATIQIKIVVSNKIVPTVSVSDYNKPYSGAEVAAETVAEHAMVTADGVTEKIEGTWSWTNGKAPKTVADSGRYSLTFTPRDSDNYSTVTTTVQVTITRKTVTLSNLAAQKEYDGTAVVNGDAVLRLSFSDTLTFDTDYTITASFDNANAGTGKNVTATVVLSDSAAENYCFAGSGGTSVQEITVTSTNGCITQKKLTIGSSSAAPKYYDGTVTVDSYGAALEGFVEDESNRPKLGTDYTITAAFDSADASTDKTVTITVTLADTEKAANYHFEVDGSASRTIQVETTSAIHRLALETMPTVKEPVVKLTQDAAVRSGSYPLSGNVNVVLPEDSNLSLELSRELRFALGTPPAKVTARIDEGDILRYTISDGKAGEKFTIPVTVTMPNLVYHDEQGGSTAAVALYAQNEPDGQTPKIDPDAGTITLSFTVEVELTGGSGSGGVGVVVTPPVLIKDDHLAYMQGDGNSNFRPSANLTRAEAATIFYNLLADKSMGSSNAYFTDVKENEWYATAVETLASRGILGGYKDGSFRPSNNITRAEFAAIASRFDDLSTGTVTLKDVHPDHWAYNYIVSATAKGWITGYEDNTFKPENNITRAEVVTLVNRVLDRIPDKDYIDKNIDDIKVLKDVTKTHWAYYNIIEATNGHDYTKDSKGTETWNKLK